MSRCEACASEKTCHPKDSSRFYRKDDKTPVIALLGQPNSGKSEEDCCILAVHISVC